MALLLPILGAVGLFGDSADIQAQNTLSIDVSNTLKIMNETLVSNKIETMSTVLNSQTATIEVAPGAVVNGNVLISQKIDVTSETSGRLDASVLSSMSAKIVSDLKVAADQAANATSQWFSTSTAASNNVTTIKNAIETAVTDTLKTENWNLLISQVINTETATIYIRGTVNGDVTITQNIVAKIIASNAMSVIVKKINDVLQTSKSDLHIAQTASATAEGLSGIINNWTNGLTTSSIISAVILCLIIISLAIVAMSPAGQSSINKASNAAAARYGAGIK